jgi:ATP-dependent DNA helicase RecG
VTTAATLEELIESVDFEAKLARGSDGQGEVPRSLWETYSAFANTNGGAILLGVEDKKGQLRSVGLANPQRVVDQFWNAVNNPSCVSANLLRDQDVSIQPDATVWIRVPRAPRSARPVHVGANPLSGSFRRRGSADQKCSPDEVRRMLAEQVENSRDERICTGLQAEDLNEPTVRRYRQRFQAHAPAHPWNSLDDREFLRSIGAWRKDRETGQGAVTQAGLLMFGRLPDIIDEFSHYFLDYQERTDANPELRWVDRVCTDGSWSGNLYDFYTTVIAKLGEGLGGPWQLRGDQRIDDPQILQALREALVNALIHADFTGRTSIQVVKRPDLFAFRNPGGFRVPMEDAQKGGDSDCRNRRLQAMFRYVGFGDQAGSGLPKILEAWRGLNWRLPRWSETPGANEQTQLELPRASLLAAPVVAALRDRHGLEFDKLAITDRVALALAVEEGEVTHTRLLEIAGGHSRDATLALYRLVQRGLLVAVDRRRPVTYAVPDGALTSRNQDLFAGIEATVATARGSGLHDMPATLVADALIMQAAPVTLNDTLPTLNDRAVTLQAEPATLNDTFAMLNEASAPVFVDGQRNSRRQRASDTERLAAAIVAACAAGWLTVDEIAVAVGRSVTYVRNAYLPKLVASGRLEQRFAGKARHRGQAYRARKVENQG